MLFYHKYFKDKSSELDVSESFLMFSLGLRTFTWDDLSLNFVVVVVGRWKEIIYITFKKCSFWSKTLGIILETFPGHFMNDISYSYNASSKATWASTILPGNCKEWDLSWPWHLRKLAYRCKQRPGLWTCQPSISWVSASQHAKEGFVCRDHIPQIPAWIMRNENYMELIHCLYHWVNILNL